MADKSSIEWTDATWNVITGCSRVSSGCGGPDGGGCYAERLAATRLRRHPSRRGLTDRHGRWTGEVRFNEQWLDQPLRWQKPRRIFVCAHSDLFHESVPAEWIDRVFAVMALCPDHTFQVLTKRPGRMRRYLLEDSSARVADIVSDRSDRYWPLDFQARVGFDRFRETYERLRRDTWILPNVWLGTSAEDKPTADQRIWELLEIPAAVHWVSLEPLLGPICLSSLAPERLAPTRVDALRGRRLYGGSEMRCRALDWVVVGGESGPGYRPMEPDWAREIELQCRYSGVAFFMKQMAGKKEIPSDLMVRQMPTGRA